MRYDSLTGSTPLTTGSFTAGDDDDDENNGDNDEEQVPEPGGETGNYNFGDDFGTRVGEGHDPEAEPI